MPIASEPGSASRGAAAPRLSAPIPFFNQAGNIHALPGEVHAATHRVRPAFATGAAWAVRYEPVADQVRLFGMSKCGFMGPLGAGVADRLGMIWLERRGGDGAAAERKDPRAGS